MARSRSRKPSARCAEPEWQITSVNHLDGVWPAINALVAAMESAGFPQKQAFAARLALEEAISNGLKHGNKNDPKKRVMFRWHVADGVVQAEVEDEGPGFRPEAVPDPLAPENLEREGGRGILLIRSYMTQVEFNEKGNCIRMSLERQ